MKAKTLFFAFCHVPRVKHTRLAVYLMLLIFTNFLGYVKCSFVESRRWHEEVVDIQGGNTKVLYPRYKVCRAPREKPEKLKIRHVSVSESRHAEVTWAELIAIYTSDSGAEIYNWDLHKQQPDPDKATRVEQFVSILIFLLAFLIIFMIFVFLVPIVGSLGFQLYSLIWYIIFHPEIRRICRRIFIAKEKLSRKHMQLLLTKYASGGTKATRRAFRLPFILREYNEEEIPAELQQSAEEDTDGEISSEGFENLLFHKAESRPSTIASKALAQMLVNTERDVGTTT